jgi:hypothetical protein
MRKISLFHQPEVLSNLEILISIGLFSGHCLGVGKGIGNFLGA